MQRNDEPRITLGIADQLVDIEFLNPLQHGRRRLFPAVSRFLQHDAVDLLNFIKVVAEPQDHKKGAELPIDDESPKENQHQDEGNWNNADEDISYHEAPLKPPEESGAN